MRPVLRFVQKFKKVIKKNPDLGIWNEKIVFVQVKVLVTLSEVICYAQFETWWWKNATVTPLMNKLICCRGIDVVSELVPVEHLVVIVREFPCH